MNTGDDLAQLADPNLHQHFLVSPEKLSLIVNAAGISRTDHVVELGAGVGTVARMFPPSASLTVVELDTNLIEHLHRNVPDAHVINDDAIRVVGELRCDVLIVNLPHHVTESLLADLPALAFRTALLTVGPSNDLRRLDADFEQSLVTVISGNDFTPPQDVEAHIVKIVRKHKLH